MNNEEQFKENLQHLVASKEFPFSESDWESASAYIESRRNKRRRAALLFLSLGLLLFTGAGTWLLLGPSRTPVAMLNPPARSQAETRVQAPRTLPATTASPENAVPAVQPAETKAPQWPASPKAPAAESPAESAPQAVEEMEQHEPRSKRAEEIQEVPQPFVVNTDSDSLPQHPTGRVQVLPGNGVKVADPEAVVVRAPEEQQETPSTVQPVTENPLPEAKDTTTSEKALTATTQQTGSLRSDSSATEKLQPALPGVKEILLSLEGGISWMAGWKSPEGRDGQGLNPVFGFQYYNYLTDKLALSFGGQYNRVGNLSYSSFSSRITRYTLGEESAVTVITPARLHYIAVPLRLNYFADSKNIFGLGYSIAYLLNVVAQVEKYNLVMGERKEYKKYTTAGYTEGFRIFDSQLSVFYKRGIYRTMALKAELFYGLSDVKDNVFFNLALTERNMGLKLTVVYDIMRK